MKPARAAADLSASELSYREHAFLVDKQALPHPGFDAASLELLIPWALLVVGACTLALFGVWKMRSVQVAGFVPDAALRGGNWRVATGLFLTGLALRLWGIGVQPADSQELTYLLQVVFPREVIADPWLGALLTLLAPHMVSPHPPLYRLILMGFLGDAHDLEWLRMPAALAGAATVPAVYLLGTRIFGHGAGILAGGLLCVSPFHIYFSQSVTPYTLVGFLVVLAYLLHHRALRPGGPWRSYVGVLSLGFLSHFSVPALYAPLAIEAFWRYLRGERTESERARFWRFFAAGACALVPFFAASAGLFFYREMIPHIFPMIHAMALFPPVEAMSVALMEFFIGALGFFAHGVMSTFASPEAVLPTLVASVVALLGVGCGLAARRSGLGITTLAVLLFALFFFALGALTIASNGFFYFASRRFVPVVPFLVIFWAGGLCALHKWSIARWSKGIVATGLLALVLAGPIMAQGRVLVRQSTEVVKPDMRGIALALSEVLKDGDGVATGPYVFFDFLYAYHAGDAVPEWYFAGGAPRWTQVAGAEGADRWVMLSVSDIALPWQQTLEHAGLKRLWLLEIDEAPYGLRELKGAGTIHADALVDAGWRACDRPVVAHVGVTARCFEGGESPRLHDTLRIGEGDYRQVLGWAPPGSVRSYARRIAPKGGLFFPRGTPPSVLELDVLRWFDEPVELYVDIMAGETQLKQTVSLNERKQRVTVPIDLPAGAAGEALRVELSVSDALIEQHASCFRPRRERYRRGWLDCGLYLRKARLVRPQDR